MEYYRTILKKAKLKIIFWGKNDFCEKNARNMREM